MAEGRGRKRHGRLAWRLRLLGKKGRLRPRMERCTGRGGDRRETPWMSTAVHHETVVGVRRDWSSPGHSACNGAAAEVLMRSEHSEQQNDAIRERKRGEKDCG
ncbi:Peptidase aspartic, catalytic [Sesbania bispinosa]|nr:Peptidase aspartic, catalytic [Sesbania bispinosa]